MEENLPELTEKQDKFLKYYFQNGRNASKAYRYAYDSKASERTVWVESSRLLKNPKVTPWIEYYKTKTEEFAQKEMEYTVQDCANDLDSALLTALESLDKQGNPNLSAILKAIELKGKLHGKFKDQVELHGGAVVQMSEIKVDDKNLTFNIGSESSENSEVKDDTDSSTDA
ncbi:MAG: terminase small subunit [Candidatus Gastranaerophilales bacterium]|nr:terminase small subunit [Candidatus Gastranaerophilales bacterium]